MVGVHNGQMVRRGQTHVIDFVLGKELRQPPILGLTFCEVQNLGQRVYAVSSQEKENPSRYPPIINEFADVFNGLGKLPGEHDIKLVEGAVPSVCAASRFPFKELVFKKLNEMRKKASSYPCQSRLAE